jgi:hypothetical protein
MEDLDKAIGAFIKVGQNLGVIWKCFLT